MEAKKPIVDPIRLQAWRLFLTVHAETVDALAAELEAETDLPLPWYEVLLYLRESDEGRLRMHELAASLLLSRSALTRFIDRMERAGLVTRQRCDSDRRGMFVVMTDEGRARFSAAAPVHLRGIQEHFARYLTPDEAELISGVFGRILGAHKRYEERAGLRSA